ncbi:MAG TPA: hypothetical protein VG604_01775, partial [Candidatus Saccharimonadales bacterium]|nr:hypothetical protein [Candidatus Saccharimonadales bacterium]
YTWQETAKKALNALAQPLPAASNDKPRLAIFAPDPAGYSSIGRITQLMHPTLSRYFKIDYYLEKTREGNTFSRPCYLAEIANIYPSSYFNAKRYADYDAVLYHLGNSEYHLDTIKNALHLPGFIITHDLNLTNVFEGVLGRFAYMEPQRLAAERTLDELLKTTKTSRLTSLVNASLGAITHSKYAAEAVSEIDQHGSLPILSTQLPTAVPKLDRVNLEGRFKLGFGGIINPVKGVSLVDQIINSDDLRQVDIHIFGIPLMSPAELDRLQSLPNVTVETNLSDFAFESRLSAMDAIVNYRPQYNGESSQTVIDALRYGVVPIVRRIGWFDELPDDCVEKVDSEDEVLAAVTRLVTKADYLKQKKQAAKQYAVDTYGYERYADQLQKFIIDNYSNAKTPNGKLAAAIRAGAKKSDLLKQLKG